MMEHQTKSAIFDMGNVLVRFSYDRAFQGLSRLTGKDPQIFKEILFKSGFALALESGQMNEYELFAKVKSMIGSHTATQEFIDCVCDIFTPYPEMEDMLAEVKQTGVRMVLLSNVSDMHFQYLRQRYDFFKHFDDFVLSYVVGSCKPEKQIYESAVKAAQTAPEHCFFTDDVHENIIGARNFGMDAHHFIGHEDLRDALIKRGLLSASHT